MNGMRVSFTPENVRLAPPFLCAVLDNESTDQEPPTDVTNTAELTIAGFAPATYCLIGAMDDLRMYNRALTAAEVGTLYHGEGIRSP